MSRLGPQLFPGWEDSAGHPKVFRFRSSADPKRVPGQMFPMSAALGNPRSVGLSSLLTETYQSLTTLSTSR